MTRYYSTHPGPLPLESGAVLSMGERTPDNYKLTGSDLAHLETGRLVEDDYIPEPEPKATTRKTKGATDE